MELSTWIILGVIVGSRLAHRYNRCRRGGRGCGGDLPLGEQGGGSFHRQGVFVPGEAGGARAIDLGVPASERVAGSGWDD